MNTFDLAYEMTKTAARGDYLKKFIQRPMNSISKTTAKYPKADSKAVDTLISKANGNVKAYANAAVRDAAFGNAKLDYLVKHRAPGKAAKTLRDTLEGYGSSYGSIGDAYEGIMKHPSLAPKQRQLANNVALGSRIGAHRMYSASDRVSKAFKLGN